MKKLRSQFKSVAIVLIILATILVFVSYFRNHPEVSRQLHNTSLGLLTTLLSLYLLGLLALAMVLHATLRLCNIKLGKQESVLLTMYSSVINFFGPLQSGPAFRAVYLKQKYQMKLKQYTVATLVYYLFYGGLSVILLLSSVLGLWLIPLAVAGLLVFWYAERLPFISSRIKGMALHNWYYLAVATFLQIAIVTAIYYRELVSIAPGTHLSQAITYSGAANLSLFVSITPGAIGFRESFLVFSRHLHHISNSTIVSASILDRSIYIVLMLIAAAIVFGTHAANRLKREANAQ